MSSVDPLGTSLYFSAAAQARKKETETKKAEEKLKAQSIYLRIAVCSHASFSGILALYKR